MTAPSGLVIRPAEPSDWEGIWPVFHTIVARGETYAYDPATPREEAERLWMGAGGRSFVAELDGRVVGTYRLKPNQPGLGSHVANCSYMVAAEATRRGVGRALCEHSLDEARRAGYTAMQFNLVVSTNQGAVRLWKAMGFTILATLPRAFRHARLGPVDAYVMHRFL